MSFRVPTSEEEEMVESAKGGYTTSAGAMYEQQSSIALRQRFETFLLAVVEISEGIFQRLAKEL